MKKKGLLVTLSVMFIGLVFSVAYFALADKEGIEIQNGKTTVTQVQSEDLFLSNGVIEVKKDIDGDLMATGGNITVDGNISDNLVVAGGMVNVKKEVSGDVMIFGGMVNIQGDVFGDVTVFGGSVDISGNVWDDCRVFSGTLKLSGDVSDNLMVRAQEIDRADRVAVGGEEDVVQVEVKEQAEDVAPKEDESKITAKSAGVWLLRTVLTMVGWVVVSLLVLKLAPVKSMELMKAGSSWKDALISIGIGFLAIPAALMVVLLLSINRIGWPLVAIILGAGILISVVGWLFPIPGIVYTRMKKKKYMVAMIVGVALTVFLSRIPWGIGLLTRVVLTAWGIGAALVYKFRLLNEAPKKKK